MCAATVRQLFGNPSPAGIPLGDAWPVVHALPYALVCATVITAAFMALALGRFRQIVVG
ncbi:hypothetical protein [Streptomyces niveus]|uniref:hypothetical protein n=1 Tax=Streptomyces niveus TaxID=193462 RepID=UPI0020D2719B|nr:hypothetical protein [Streptomyces niveus]